MDRRTLFGIVAGLAAGGLAGGCSAAPTGPVAAAFPERPVLPWKPPAVPATSSLTGFAGDLLEALAPTPANMVCSPWSIAMVLSMVREGAAGATASEIDRVLGASAPALGNELGVHSRTLLADPRLTAANALWAQVGFTWGQPFLDRLGGPYAAPLRNADFSAHAGDERVRLNQWVADHTAGRIPELFSIDMITPGLRLVLVNAIHFAARWAEAFDEIGNRPFTRGDGTRVDAPTLSGSGEWPALHTDAWTVVAVPCEGGQHVLVVALPDDPADKTVPPSELFGQAAGAPRVRVRLDLPRWTTDFRATLNDTLNRLGMPTAFDDGRADLSVMTTDAHLFLSFVAHQATIEVTAGGIEAAAATGAGAAESAGHLTDLAVVADRPFCYALLHVPTRTPLFVGRLSDPTA